MNLAKFTGLLLTLVLAMPAWAEVRTWTDTQGRPMRAEFIRELNGEATFLRAGRLITLPLDKLSEKDQQYIRDVVAGKTPGEEPAATPSVEPEPAPAVESAPTPTVGATADEPPVTRTDPAVPTRPGIPSRPGAAAPPIDDPFALPGETRTNPGGAGSGNDERPKASSRPKPPVDANRVWTDIRGQSTTAKFVRMFGRNVVLSRASKVLTVPYDGLSAADQQFLQELLTERGLEAQIPPPLARDDGSGPSGDAPAFNPGEAMQRNVEDLNQRAEEARQRAAESRQAAIDLAEQQRQEREEQLAEANRQAEERRQEYLAQQEEARQQREQEAADRMEQQRAAREAYTANQPAGKCSKCFHVISQEESQGSSCPYCSAVWTYKEDQFGRKNFTGAVDSGAVAKGMGVLVVVGVVILGVFAAFIAIVVAIVRSIANAGKTNRRREIY